MLRAADVSFAYRRVTRRARAVPAGPAPAHVVEPVRPELHDHVLRNVVLEVNRGDLVGILGPNGSGKTTLLKLLGGVFPPASGSVTLDGRPLAGWSHREIARRVAFVPQETNAPFDFTVLDIVLMGRFPHLGAFALEGPEDLAIARQAMEATGTAAFEERAFSTLSGGEKQRVVIASALAQSTALLLLDEPTASLDIGHQIEVQTLLRRLNTASGVTMVLSTHDLNLAAALCRRLILLKDGQVLAAGPTEEVLTPETVRGLYDVDAEVVWHPRAGHLTVVPIGRN
jgi:iron complex transport system ATP-binding protein